MTPADGKYLIRILDHIVLLPVMLPFAGGIVAFLLYRRHRLQAIFTTAVYLLSVFSAVSLLLGVLEAKHPLSLQVGGWAAPFGITLVADLFAALFVLMSQLVLFSGALYANGCKDKCVSYPTFYPLFLFLGAGLCGAMLAGDVFNLFVFIELLAISSTVLTAISDDRFGIEAAYKYFYISQLAAFFLLLAVGSLYVGCGTLNMAHLASLMQENHHRLLVPFSACFLLLTFMIKSATFPFHFWQPDFHTAAPTPVSAMLSSVVVKLGVYGFIRMQTLLFVGYAPKIGPLLTGLGIAGIVYGGISAIGTHNVKRMLAYSTLAQVGFILVGIGWGTTAALGAAIVFAVNHSIAKSSMLMLAGYIASRAPVKTAAFKVVTGVGRTLPLAGALFLIGAAGLAGIPPTNGFISKMLIFKSGIAADQLWTLLVMGLASIFTLVYTIRAFMRIWWNAPENGPAKPTGDKLPAPLLLIILVLLLGIAAEPLVGISLEAAKQLGHPAIYIQSILGD